MNVPKSRCRDGKSGERQNLFYRMLGAIGRFLMRVVWWPTKIYYKEKFPGRGNVICVCNHYSAIDANAIYSRLFAFKGRIAVKAEALKSKFVEKGMAALCRAIGVKRGKSDLGAVKSMLGELKAKKGYKSDTDLTEDFKSLLPFKDGAAAIAVKSGAVIVPTLYYRPLRPFGFRKNRLIVGDPIDVSEYVGKKAHEVKSEITRIVREKMQDMRRQIDEIVEKYHGSVRKYEKAKAKYGFVEGSL